MSLILSICFLQICILLHNTAYFIAWVCDFVILFKEASCLFMCYSRLILESFHQVHQVIIRSHVNTRYFNYCSLSLFGGLKKLENFPFWTILYFHFYLFIKLKNIYWEPTAFQYSSFPYSGSDGEETACNAGDLGSVPGLGRSPGEGNGNSLQYSCLENSRDRGAWWATVHGVT